MPPRPPRINSLLIFLTGDCNDAPLFLLAVLPSRQVCGGPPGDADAPSSAARRAAATMLECEHCLRGYHMGCLAPPLDVVPEGQWLCPACSGDKAGPSTAPAAAAGPGHAGGGGPGPRRRTLRERFLAREAISGARIDSIWRDGPCGEYFFTARWYALPEETHTGRQPHHARRELFLTNATDEVRRTLVIIL